MTIRGLQFLGQCQLEQSCLWPFRCFKLFGESLQMRIRTRRRIWQQETVLFVSASMETENNHIVLWKLQRKRAGQRGEKSQIKTLEGLSFSVQDVVYVVDRPFNLPKLFLWGLFGSSLWVCSLWSLHSRTCIIYESCGCYSDCLIETVYTSSWNKNNEGTINLSAVNSHLREQNVRFLFPRSLWHQWYVFLLDRSKGLASRPISHWISFNFKPQPKPPLLYQWHELRLNPQKVFFIFCRGSKSSKTQVCFWGINYAGFAPKQTLIQLFEIDLRAGL